MYTLKRTAAIDVCETKGRKGLDDDERAWCVAALTGSATIYGEATRGAWVKTDPDKGAVTTNVTRNCDAATLQR